MRDILAHGGGPPHVCVEHACGEEHGVEEQPALVKLREGKRSASMPVTMPKVRALRPMDSIQPSLTMPSPVTRMTSPTSARNDPSRIYPTSL